AVQKLSLDHVPARLLITRYAQENKRNANARAKGNQHKIEPCRTPGAEHTALEERHAHQHEASGPPENEKEQAKRFHDQGSRPTLQEFGKPALSIRGDFGGNAVRRRL